jgi:quercetin dioxygenase-like cupin family protein
VQATLETSELAPWKSGWTAEKPLDFDYDWSPASGAEWQPLDENGSLFRDLGLLKASKGLMRARQIRYGVGAKHLSDDWRAHDLDFEFIYVLGGTAMMELEGGVHQLKAGAAITQPGFTRYRLYDVSADFEMIEILGPGSFDTFWGKGAALPDRAKTLAGAPATYSFETPDSYAAAAGPRPYFYYRDLGTAKPTGDRIYIHAVKMIPPAREGGTGWHNHTMRQWFYVLGGHAELEMEVFDSHIDKMPLTPGDAMTVSMGQRHDVPTYTDDYFVLEMCIPKEYDTDPREKPEGLDVEDRSVAAV